MKEVKKPWVDKPMAFVIIKIERALLQGGQPYQLTFIFVNRSGAAGRLTRFWGYVNHNRQDYEETHQKPQDQCPAFRSHLPHPLPKGVTNRHNCSSARFRDLGTGFSVSQNDKLDNFCQMQDKISVT